MLKLQELDHEIVLLSKFLDYHIECGGFVQGKTKNSVFNVNNQGGREGNNNEDRISENYHDRKMEARFFAKLCLL